jgi:Ca-activated chloride channel family protein
MWTLAWWWVLAAAPLPWIVRRTLPADAAERGTALKPPSLRDFADLPPERRAVTPPRRRLAVLTAIWLLALLAATRPVLISDTVTLPATGRDLLLAVDLSGSMAQRDFHMGNEWVDRLTALKSVATAFIDRRIGDRIGLILFGREAFLQAPLTFDRRTVRALLDEATLGLAGRETAIGDAIGLAIRTLDDAGVADGRRVLILLTDGANTAGAAELVQATELAVKRHLVIYPIGILPPAFDGKPGEMPVDFDEAALVAIAQRTGGRYFAARQTREFEPIYAILDQLEPAESDEQGFRPITELFQWPLAAAVLLALGAAATTAATGAMRPRRSANESASHRAH